MTVEKAGQAALKNAHLFLSVHECLSDKECLKQFWNGMWWNESSILETLSVLHTELPTYWSYPDYHYFFPLNVLWKKTDIGEKLTVKEA